MQVKSCSEKEEKLKIQTAENIREYIYRKMNTSSQAHWKGDAVVHLYTHASDRPEASVFIHLHGSLGPSSSLPPHNSCYTDPARKCSTIPVLGVNDDPIQYGLKLDANANQAARVQA